MLEGLFSLAGAHLISYWFMSSTDINNVAYKNKNRSYKNINGQTEVLSNKVNNVNGSLKLFVNAFTSRSSCEVDLMFQELSVDVSACAENLLSLTHFCTILMIQPRHEKGVFEVNSNSEDPNQPALSRNLISL